MVTGGGQDDNDSIYQRRMKVENSNVGLGDGIVVTIPSFSDFPIHTHKSDDSIRSRSRLPEEGSDGKIKQGTMASITQGIEMMPDSVFIHKYLFKGNWYKNFRSLFLVSDQDRIHRLGYRSPVSVFVERSRHLASYPNTIHPYSAFRWYWDILMTLFILATLVVDPLRMTFYAQDVKDGDSTQVDVSIVITTVYLIDIILNFRTGIVGSRNAVVNLDPRSIALEYIKTWFFVDLLSTIPFDLMYILYENGKTGPRTEDDLVYLKAVRLLELLKVFRLTRAVRYISRLLFVSIRTP